MSANPELDEFRREFRQRRLEQLGTIGEKAQARGALPGNVAPVTIIEMIIGPLWFRELVSMEPWDDWPTETMIDTVLKGVGTTP